MAQCQVQGHVQGLQSETCNGQDMYGADLTGNGDELLGISVAEVAI